MASEFFAEGGKEVAVKITPGTGGIMQVFIDGDKVFDKKEEGNKFPDLPRVKQMRALVKQKLSSLVAADD